jgi:hypothetical protein
MIDPSNITKFDRTDEELEEFALFAPAVAGKTAKIQALKLDNLLSNLRAKYGEGSPFDVVKRAAADDSLEKEMRVVKLGKYSTLVPCYKGMSLVNRKDGDEHWLRKVPVETLKKYPGIGNKTARFFVMHSRKDAEVATLDTHVLSWMDENLEVNVHERAPRSDQEYERLEHHFLQECEKRGRHPARLDLKIWNSKSK